MRLNGRCCAQPLYFRAHFFALPSAQHVFFPGSRSLFSSPRSWRPPPPPILSFSDALSKLSSSSGVRERGRLGAAANEPARAFSLSTCTPFEFSCFRSGSNRKKGGRERGSRGSWCEAARAHGKYVLLEFSFAFVTARYTHARGFLFSAAFLPDLFSLSLSGSLSLSLSRYVMLERLNSHVANSAVVFCSRFCVKIAPYYPCYTVIGRRGRETEIELGILTNFICVIY